MSEYLELYKKYRPKTWDEVVGQDEIVESIRNAVIENKVPTAYLFNGLHGTGKTTIAFILAKALNCENVDERANPCNNCEICKGIDNNSLIGFKYVSTTEFGGAEAIRDLMQSARLSQPIKHQLFILDEIQNLSIAAQDSMLIGLEANDMATKFILCTTNPEKVRPAILSRTQRRTFHPVTTEKLVKHLIKIIKNENLVDKFTKDSVVQAALNSNGSVRNAIQNIELIASGGSLPNKYSIDLLERVFNGKTLEVYDVIKEMTNDGQDFISTLEEVYRNLTLILQIKAGRETKDNKLLELSNSIKGNTLMSLLNETIDTLRLIASKAVDGKILFEICLTKMALISKKEKS